MKFNGLQLLCSIPVIQNIPGPPSSTIFPSGKFTIRPEKQRHRTNDEEAEGSPELHLTIAECGQQIRPHTSPQCTIASTARVL